MVDKPSCRRHTKAKTRQKQREAGEVFSRMGTPFLIMLREGLEIALILAIVLGYLRKTGRRQQAFYVWLGTAAAVLASVSLAAMVWFLAGEFEGRSRQLFEGAIMLTAVVVVTSMIFWIQRQAASYARRLEERIDGALPSQHLVRMGSAEPTGPGAGWGRGQKLALAGIGFTAVLREGVESVLLLAGWWLEQGNTRVVAGATLGVAAAALLAYLLFRATLRLSLHRFFLLTGLFLIVVAAGLLAGAVHELQEARLLPTGLERVWDTSNYLDDRSTVGMLLRALVGYRSAPSLWEAVAWTAYMLLVGGRFLWWTLRPYPAARAGGAV